MATKKRMLGLNQVRCGLIEAGKLSEAMQTLGLLWLRKVITGHNEAIALLLIHVTETL